MTLAYAQRLELATLVGKDTLLTEYLTRFPTVPAGELDALESNYLSSGPLITAALVLESLADPMMTQGSRKVGDVQVDHSGQFGAWLERANGLRARALAAAGPEFTELSSGPWG